MAAAQTMAPSYRVTTFTSPKDSFPRVKDINNAGQLAGQLIIQQDYSSRAFLSEGGALRVLNTPTGFMASANSVNDRGDVVGNAVVAGEPERPERAFLYSGGRMRDLGTLGGGWASAAGINNAGQVIGTSANADGQTRTFLYSNGRMQDLSSLVPGGLAITAHDINEQGDIAGTWIVDGEPRAFLYSAGTWTDLGDIGGMNAYGYSLNDKGWVTGEANRVDARDVPFLYTPEAGMRELTFPNDAFLLTGRGINNRGEVIGDGYSDHGPCCTFLSRDGSTTSLDGLLERGSGWNIYQALAINEHSQVAAYGCGAPGCMVVRLDPVPEPATWAMLAGGLALLWLRRRPGKPPKVRSRDARRSAERSVTAKALAICALIGIAAASPARAGAPPRYTITPYPPGGADARATELNQRGHMLGMLLRSGGPWVDNGVRSAFLTTGPSYVDLGLVMAGFRPAGLNDLDQVAGTAVVGVQGRTRAYLFQNGAVSNLGTLGGINSGASAINNRGQVAGFSSLANGGPDHAMLYQDGVMRDIGTLGTSSHALDINERGQVTGDYTNVAGHTRAFVYENGAMRDIGTLGGDDARATDIGNEGHILGISRTADGAERNFIYHAGVMTALPDAGGPQPVRAFGINGAGDAVGSRPEGEQRGAWLWSQGQIHDINQMVSPRWTVRDAVAINDLGQIAATGCLDGDCSAVLLSPVPEPAASLMLLAGLGAIGLLQGRRVHWPTASGRARAWRSKT